MSVILAGLTCFNGATAMKPWKTIDLIACFRSGSSRFNGATAMKPWKTMPIVEFRSSAVVGFNGATAMKPWKTSDSRRLRPLPRSLQWGHGDEAVEDGPPSRSFENSILRGISREHALRRGSDRGRSIDRSTESGTAQGIPTREGLLGRSNNTAA